MMAEEEEQEDEEKQASSSSPATQEEGPSPSGGGDDGAGGVTNKADRGEEQGSGSGGSGHGSSGAGVEVVNDPSDAAAAAAAAATRDAAAAAAEHDDYRSPAVLSTFIDHFTLPLPSSTIRYRNARGAARVVEANEFQIVIEEHFGKRKAKSKVTTAPGTVLQPPGDGEQHDDESSKEQEQDEHSFSIRRITDRSPGVAFLRATYAIVTIFWTGFLFVFCLQVLLFLFLNLTIELGITSRPESDTSIKGAIGSILSIVPLVYGLASAMVIAGVFISDIYTGHFLIRNFALTSMKTITVEWIFFVFFVLVPLLVMCGTLLAQTEQWWIITGMTWFCCILAFYVLFTVNIVFYEMRACWEVTRNRYTGDDDSWFAVLKRSILLRQTTSYSGRKTVRFVAMGTIYDAEFTDKGGHDDEDGSRRMSMVEGTRSEFIGIKSRLFMCKTFEKWGVLKFHNTPDDPPQRIYTIEDVRDVRPYLTSYTWSLDKIFCRARDSRFIAIVNGPGAVTQDQIKSSMACSLMGSALVFMIIFSIFYFLDLSGAALGFLMTMAVLLAIPNFRSTWRLYKTVQVFKHTQLKRTQESIKKTGSDTNAMHRDKSLQSLRPSERDALPFDYPTESECIYLVTERFRISSPTVKFAWIMFGIEVGLFFVWPFVSLFMVGNYPLALLFGLVAGITGMRYYINAAIVLEETGNMDLVDGDTERETWRNQARLNEIVGNVTRGHSLSVWMSVFGMISLVYLALFAGSIGQSQTEQQTFDTPYKYLPDFSYEQADSIRYPSCRLSNELKESPITSMADFTYLAGLAYRGVNVTQRELDGWFGINVTTAQNEAVEEYRQTHEVSSQVSFKLVTHPKQFGNKTGDFAYILIRGTTNNWDMLTDAQLWSPAALMQVLRMILPFGAIWTPIMPYLINAITTVESASIAEVSFYQDTTAYANYIKKGVADGQYLGVSVTGHSLGGGLSIITGAQAQIPAVGLSGPNTMLTRLSLRPQVEANDLDKYTFNIVPERDVVPMLDDKAQNYQFIRCTAGYTDIVGCHDSTRSLCEVIYTCGTGPRPALCECVTMFGYPEPRPTGFRTFAEACSPEAVDV